MAIFLIRNRNQCLSARVARAIRFLSFYYDIHCEFSTRALIAITARRVIVHSARKISMTLDRSEDAARNDRVVTRSECVFLFLRMARNSVIITRKVYDTEVHRHQRHDALGDHFSRPPAIEKIRSQTRRARLGR